MQAEVGHDGVPRVVAKRDLQAHEDVLIVPHAVNASRPALQMALRDDADMRSVVAQLLAAPLDANGVKAVHLV